MKLSPRSIWPLGAVLIVLGGVSFVINAVSSATTHSWQERTVLVFGVLAGFVFVNVYWVKKWVGLQNVATPGETLLSRLPRRFFYYLLPIPAVIAISILMHQILMSAPEYEQSRECIKTNPAVLTRFGTLEKVEMDSSGTYFETSDGKHFGAFQFKVKGSFREGVIRVAWRDEADKFIPVEIDEISGTDDKTTLWKSLGSMGDRS